MMKDKFSTYVRSNVSSSLAIWDLDSIFLFFFSASSATGKPSKLFESLKLIW